MKNVVLRITRHPLTEDREVSLRSVYGKDVRVVTEDIPYGSDPIAAVRALVERAEVDGGKVVAVEAVGPEHVLLQLVEGLADDGIIVIRQVYKRDPETGRVIVTGKDERGRDILAFDCYEAVKVEVRKTLVGRTLT